MNDVHEIRTPARIDEFAPSITAWRSSLCFNTMNFSA